MRLKIAAPSWDDADDWSRATLDSEPRIVPRLPVYQAGKRIGGVEPE